jgi:hypothetical protein
MPQRNRNESEEEEDPGLPQALGNQVDETASLSASCIEIVSLGSGAIVAPDSSLLRIEIIPPREVAPSVSPAAVPAVSPAPAVSTEPVITVKLYKSSRLQSYITLALASFINYDATEKSSNVTGSAGVPSTADQRRYGLAVSLVSLTLSGAAVAMHLDYVTPAQKLWTAAFKPKSRVELGLAIFLALWWTIGTGVQTSLT